LCHGSVFGLQAIKHLCHRLNPPCIRRGNTAGNGGIKVSKLRFPFLDESHAFLQPLHASICNGQM
jgi:hypothetical protein